MYGRGAKKYSKLRKRAEEYSFFRENGRIGMRNGLWNKGYGDVVGAYK